MKITDIIPDFSCMSENELEEIIRSTRRSRTTVKAVTVTKRPTKTLANSKNEVKTAIGNMSSEQLSILKKLFTS